MSQHTDSFNGSFVHFLAEVFPGFVSEVSLIAFAAGLLACVVTLIITVVFAVRYALCRQWLGLFLRIGANLLSAASLYLFVPLLAMVAIASARHAGTHSFEAFLWGVFSLSLSGLCCYIAVAVVMLPITKRIPLDTHRYGHTFLNWLYQWPRLPSQGQKRPTLEDIRQQRARFPERPVQLRHIQGWVPPTPLPPKIRPQQRPHRRQDRKG